MADIKVSGLAAVAAFADTQEFGVNDSGTSRKVTGLQIRTALPQGRLANGYASVTATQGTFTAATDITGLTITVTPNAARYVRLSCQIGASSSVAGDLVAVQIQEGATVLQISQFACTLAGNAYMNHSAVILVGASAAAHTYKITMLRVSGTGNITMQAGATFPAYILAEDVGA